MSAATAGFEAPLGWLVDEGLVRLSAPRADYVELVERRHPADTEQRVTAMRPVALTPVRTVWQVPAPAPLGCYRFRVHFPWGTVEVADPWSRAVVRRKVPGHPTWSLPRRPLPPAADAVSLAATSAVLLEVHVGDATAHPSAGALHPGTYAGFAESHAAAVGGLRHVVALGVDAVELLPVTEWPVLEGDRRNHWGYMPSFLLAVAQRFGQAWADAGEGDWVGLDDEGAALDPAVELRAMIAALHAEGVGVVVDLVFNHVSGHDRNPLLLLDPGTWFHRDGEGGLRSHSGCGNDLNTAAPEMRALVLASLRRWFVELGVDGVRLDLAELIDDATLVAMRDLARGLRPDALLIAEPWSLGGYRPEALAAMGWVVWDDRYRDGVKGRDPVGPGLLFAPAADAPDESALQGLFAALSGGHGDGRLPAAHLGLSYLAAHDGYTLADFARLALGEVGPAEVVQRADVATLSAAALARLRLANALLLATHGPVMLHLGQGFGRAKVREPVETERSTAPVEPGGRLDPNSYDRDDLTNHVDWATRAANAELAASTTAWVAARRAWLRPLFAADPQFTRLHSHPAGAVGYVATPPAEDPSARAGSASAAAPVAFVANLRSAPVEVRLTGSGWRPVRTTPGVGVQRSGDGARVSLPPLGAALLRDDPCADASP